MVCAFHCSRRVQHRRPTTSATLGRMSRGVDRRSRGSATPGSFVINYRCPPPPPRRRRCTSRHQTLVAQRPRLDPPEARHPPRPSPPRHPLAHWGVCGRWTKAKAEGLGGGGAVRGCPRGLLPVRGGGVLEAKSPKVCVPKTANSILPFLKFHFSCDEIRVRGGGGALLALPPDPPPQGTLSCSAKLRGAHRHGVPS